ncbi:transglutaminase family protein [Streptomyces armeniacus]|uniref:Transglutaminase family protein n=1 Tax=Streptomyces armeniacus TaxID=83291 RepID=A0A345XK29_9ACTN|nr:transglutaminase family protein [Streptomyces armeniacus]AXK31995.1 transglutaminase family protein [Streptomyces armeniacus]
MRLTPETADEAAYLAADDIIDHDHPLVRETAAGLRAAVPDGGRYAYARAAFEYVRDAIAHSNDTGDLRVTCRASEVLRERTGICHAKAHALAALLRAEGIPAGLCYQRLGVVHGLVAVRLPGHGWVRQDPRGNKPGVDAQFRLDREQLAYVPDHRVGDYDHATLYAAPPGPVLRALRDAADRPHLDTLLPVRA